MSIVGGRKELDVKPGDIVYDAWWPWRLGVVVRVLKTRIKVRYNGLDVVWSYDVAHQRFLRRN
jgi:hypothetical protein